MPAALSSLSLIDTFDWDAFDKSMKRRALLSKALGIIEWVGAIGAVASLMSILPITVPSFFCIIGSAACLVFSSNLLTFDSLFEHKSAYERRHGIKQRSSNLSKALLDASHGTIDKLSLTTPYEKRGTGRDALFFTGLMIAVIVVLTTATAAVLASNPVTASLLVFFAVCAGVAILARSLRMWNERTTMNQQKQAAIALIQERSPEVSKEKLMALDFERVLEGLDQAISQPKAQVVPAPGADVAGVTVKGGYTAQYDGQQTDYQNQIQAVDTHSQYGDGLDVHIAQPSGFLNRVVARLFAKH